MEARAADSSICLPSRLRLADKHLNRGEWASGLVIATQLMRCAERDGCRDSAHCVGAASALMGDLRQMVGG